MTSKSVFGLARDHVDATTACRKKNTNAACGCFVPNATLDLKTMKAMLAEIEQGVDIAPAVAVPALDTEESDVLQEELGCMIIDAQGSYRYVGADSSVRFANAVAQANPASTPLGPGSAAERGTVSSNARHQQRARSSCPSPP